MPQVIRCSLPFLFWPFFSLWMQPLLLFSQFFSPFCKFLIYGGGSPIASIVSLSHHHPTSTNPINAPPSATLAPSPSPPLGISQTPPSRPLSIWSFTNRRVHLRPQLFRFISHLLSMELHRLRCRLLKRVWLFGKNTW